LAAAQVMIPAIAAGGIGERTECSHPPTRDWISTKLDRDMPDEVDPIEWMRNRWKEGDQPAPDHFAVMASVLRTYQRVVAEVEKALRPHDFGLTTYLVLITLEMSRNRTRPLGQLSKHLLIHPTSVTLVVDRLEGRGLVKRSPHPTDRRTVLAKLTRAGVRAAEDANQALADVNFGLVGLSGKDAKSFLKVLTEVRNTLGDVGSEPSMVEASSTA
jgi:DNA-binding MarR family transcriptional regulator